MKLDFGEVFENDLNACKHENYCHTYNDRLIICKGKSKVREASMRKEKTQLNISSTSKTLNCLDWNISTTTQNLHE